MLMRWVCFLVLFCLLPVISGAEGGAVGLSSDLSDPMIAIVGDCAYFVDPDIPLSFRNTMYRLSDGKLTRAYSAYLVESILSYQDSLVVVIDRRSIGELIGNYPSSSLRLVFINESGKERILDIQLPDGIRLWHVECRNGRIYIEGVAMTGDTRQSHVFIYNDMGCPLGHYSNIGSLYDTCFILDNDDQYLHIYDIETDSVYETDLLKKALIGNMNYVSYNGFLYYHGEKGLHRYSYRTHVDELLYQAEGLSSSCDFIIYRNSVYLLDYPYYGKPESHNVTVIDLDSMDASTFSISVFPLYAEIANDKLYVYNRYPPDEKIAVIDLNTLEEQVWSFDQFSLLFGR